MNHEGVSDFTNGVGEKAERGDHQKLPKYLPHTMPTINSTQMEKKKKKELRGTGGGKGWRASKRKCK